MKLNSFQIGDVSLKPGVINNDFIRATKSAIEGSKVRKGKADAAKILDKWSPSKPISLEEYQFVTDFADASAAQYKELADAWWTLKKSDQAANREKDLKEIRQKMAFEGEVLSHSSRLSSELREAGARSIIEAAAGSLVGIPGIVAAYSAYANGTTWSGPERENAQKVLAEVEALKNGTSPMITMGNSVQQVHREDLWKAMNELLDDSIQQAEDGNPVEVDIQLYELTSYEMLQKITASAKAGNKVRLNLDAGRLSFPSKDQEGEEYFSLDSTPDKARTILQLSRLRGADVGISLFPQKKLLNSASDLMHRKVIRVGNKVLISGMNANLGSGENVDSGYIVTGAAAAVLGENLARDIQDSKGATLKEIWGEHHTEKFAETNLRLGSRGFISLLDAVAGPSAAGTKPPKIETVEQLEKLAEKGGLKFQDLIVSSKESYQSDVEKMLTGRSHLQLSDKGKEVLQAQIERAIEATNTPKNLQRLDDMTQPSARKVGNTRVDVADTPVEREALVLSAISQAEKFIYLPGFVVTRAVAAAIAERREQLSSEGKKLDVRVVADAGLYPHGGTPNSYGVKLLEDRGIQPRWAKLERSGIHDRKIHAKQLITDKGEITGSTNFSTQGLRENWETSAYVHFNENDPESAAAKAKSIEQFTELWNQSFELSTIDYADYLTQDDGEIGKEWFIEETRDSAIRHSLRLIGNYERETGKLHQDILNENAEVQARKAELQAEGYSYGDATLKAVSEVLGEQEYREMLRNLDTNQTLEQLQSKVNNYVLGVDTETASFNPEDLQMPAEILFA